MSTRARDAETLTLDRPTLNALKRLVVIATRPGVLGRRPSRTERDALLALSRSERARGARPASESHRLTAIKPNAAVGLRLYKTSDGDLCVQQLRRRGSTMVPEIAEQWLITADMVPALRHLLQSRRHRRRQL